jgi:hypothetical protein
MSVDLNAFLSSKVHLTQGDEIIYWSVCRKLQHVSGRGAQNLRLVRVSAKTLQLYTFMGQRFCPILMRNLIFTLTEKKLKHVKMYLIKDKSSWGLKTHFIMRDFVGTTK